MSDKIVYTKELIRQLRGDVPQVKFADAIGVSIRTLSRWENGDALPPRNVGVLKKLIELISEHTNEVKPVDKPEPVMLKPRKSAASVIKPYRSLRDMAIERAKT